MGSGALSCGGTCMKYLLFIFNIIFFLSGGVLLALGLWMLLDPNFNDYVDVITVDGSNPYISTTIYMLIGIGAFTFIVGFFGCCGACKESPCMLCTYVVLLVIVLSAETAVAVLIIVYDEQLGEEIEKHMAESAGNPQVVEDKYDGNMSALTASWHVMQTNLHCCGGSGYKDYRANSNFGMQLPKKTVPLTCCVLDNNDPHNPTPAHPEKCMKDGRLNLKEDTNSLYTKGCYSEVVAWFDQNKIIVVCIAFGIALLQIFGIVFACCVRKEALRPSDYASVSVRA